MNRVVLASSPLVGPGAMRPVAELLREHGWDVAVPDVPAALDVFTQSVAAAAGDQAVLVGFSAAGPRLFHVAAHTDAAALVFLDARLPADGVAPDSDPRLAEFLDALPTVDGRLPPWSRWWPDAIAEMIPDADRRASFEAGCPRVSRTMFSTPIPAPRYDGPCAFVGFGEGYARDATRADALGWPVLVIDGAHHLWPVVAPEAVAAALIQVVTGLVEGAVA